jgi:hypothetical protein
MKEDKKSNKIKKIKFLDVEGIENCRMPLWRKAYDSRIVNELSPIGRQMEMLE